MDGLTIRASRFTAYFVASLIALTVGCESNVKKSPDASASKSAAEATLSSEEILNRANAAYAEKEWQTAESLYRQVTQQVPAEAQPWFRLGNIYARTERPEFAVAAYKEALIRNPESSKSWYNMGIVQLRQAANSYLQMQAHTDEDSSEHARAKAMYDTIIEFIRVGPQAKSAGSGGGTP